MVFEVPKSKRSIKQNRYQFTFDGEKFELPKMQYIPVGVSGLLKDERINEAFEALADGNARLQQVLMGLDSEQIQALFADWESESDVTAGESPASES